MSRDWLAARRSEVAADRILDAAAELFAQREVAGVGMHEIARAAGCSRATLYRYFENREALHTAFVHRETYRLHYTIIDQITGIEDPGDRLVAGVIAALRLVRYSPALTSWFSASQPPLGSLIADQDDVVKALTAAFLTSLGPDEPAVVERRARWLVRVMTSLLVFPGEDETDERAMVREFVVPMVVAPKLAADVARGAE
ncbi:MAG: TetR/AcrR family transcriptional regulator [Mycobacteriaceae bacterium]|nr:TetR/AcrR family transcriptional regulator [Mycobacteriaceae bacterium]